MVHKISSNLKSKINLNLNIDRMIHFDNAKGSKNVLDYSYSTSVRDVAKVFLTVDEHCLGII